MRGVIDGKVLNEAAINLVQFCTSWNAELKAIFAFRLGAALVP